ncbi:methyltransferase domain-containing protein [archaeon]|nr:methyltransferase domain-containing protein [archaeon]
MKIKKFLKQEEPYYNTERDPIRFVEKYNEKYNTLYYKKKAQEVLRLINFDLQNKKVLDIGCCAGFLSINLAKKGAIVTGIDSSEYAINAALHNAKENQVENQCKFIKEDFNLAEFQDKFDLVIAKDVIEHIQEDETFLKKIESLLNHNGKVIITTQNSFSFNYIFEGVIRKLLGQKRWVGWDSTHVRWYNPWKLKRKFKVANLKVKNYSSSYFFPYEMSKVLTQKEPKSKIHTLIDDHLGNKKPFNLIGWSISAIGEKK